MLSYPTPCLLRVLATASWTSSHCLRAAARGPTGRSRRAGGQHGFERGDDAGRRRRVGWKRLLQRRRRRGQFAMATTNEAVAGAGAADDDNYAADTATVTATEKGAVRVGDTGSANPTAGAGLEWLCTMGSTTLPAGAGLTDSMDSDGIVDGAAQVDTFDDEAVQAANDEGYQDGDDMLFDDDSSDDDAAICPNFDDWIFDSTPLVPAIDDCPVFDTPGCASYLTVPDALPGNVQDNTDDNQASHAQALSHDPVHDPVHDHVSVTRSAPSNHLAIVPGLKRDLQRSRQPVDTTVAALSLATDALAAPSLATLSVFAHNASVFWCIACSFATPQLATELRAHRHRRHRGTLFTDVFHSGCVCAMSSAQRAAATRHSLLCGTAHNANFAGLLMPHQTTVDTLAAGEGSTVTRRDNPPDFATPSTSSSRPWMDAHSRRRVSSLSTGTLDQSFTSTEEDAALTEVNRLR